MDDVNENAREYLFNTFFPAENISLADDLKTNGQIAELLFNVGYDLSLKSITELMDDLSFKRTNLGNDSFWLLKRK
jgi:hypothetical protein